MRQSRVLFLVLSTSLIILSGCDSPAAKKAGGVLQTAGLMAAPEPTVISIDLLCDRPACSPATLPAVLDLTLTEVSARPRSELREWVQGDDVTTTQLVAQRISPAADETSEAIRRAAARKFVAEGSTALQQAVASMITSKPHASSPVPESITKIALTPPSVESWRRIIIVQSDARYVASRGKEGDERLDFECGDLPDADAFVAHLHAAQVLPPGSLRGIDIIISGAAVAPVDANRCMFSLPRARDVERLWFAALRAAGARSITYVPSLVSAADIDRILNDGGAR